MGQKQRDVTADQFTLDYLKNPQNYRQAYSQYYSDVMADRGRGLPNEIRDIYFKQGQGMIGGNLRTNMQKLREMSAGTGQGIGADALIDGLTGLHSQANQSYASLADQVAMRDYDATERNKDRLGGLADMEARDYATRLDASLKQQGVGVATTEQANSGFDWQKIAGGLLSAGGAVAGGELSRK